MSRFSTQVRSRSSAAKCRRAKPWIPPWRTSSAPQETSSTRNPSSGCVAQPLGERDQHRDGGQVVVCARADRAASDVGEHGHRRAASRARPAPASPRRPLSAPDRGQGRRAQHRPPQRQRGVDPLDDPGEGLGQARPGRGGRRSRRSARRRGGRARPACARPRGSPQLRDHVPGRRGGAVARRNTRGPLEMSSAIAAVTERRGRAAELAPAPREPGGGGDRAARGEHPDQARVAVEELLLLDLRPRSRPARRRSAIQCAASLSPSEPARRSSGASASTTSRRVACSADWGDAVPLVTSGSW